jgi:hypothetical protein
VSVHRNAKQLAANPIAKYKHPVDKAQLVAVTVMHMRKQLVVSLTPEFDPESPRDAQGLALRRSLLQAVSTVPVKVNHGVRLKILGQVVMRSRHHNGHPPAPRQLPEIVADRLGGAPMQNGTKFVAQQWRRRVGAVEV